ncbi:hypothetical protein EON83_27325 [bacterium]|nr:MAG: hypothetical protein EON83_27325 [bacterium]
MSLQVSKRIYRRFAGAMLLALPLGAIASGTRPAQAQPVPPTTTAPTSLAASPAVKKVLGLAQQSNVCQRLIDIKTDNASFADVVERIKEKLPTNTLKVEVRGANPVSVSLDLKQAKVGDILSNVAALAGCKLFVHDAQLIVGPPAQLSAVELADFRQQKGGDWLQSRDSGGAEWGSDVSGNLLLLGAIAQEAVGADQGSVKTTFGKFSPESQEILLALAASLNARQVGIIRAPGTPPVLPLHLGASSPIKIEATGPENISVLFPADLSNPNAPTTGIRVGVSRYINMGDGKPPANTGGNIIKP